MSMNDTLTWVLIVLYSGILFFYFRNIGRTYRFWKKERPKQVDHHWKSKFPLIDHLTLTTEKKKLIQSGVALLALLLVVYWSQRDTETELYALMVATFFFACLMLVREFPQHIFLKGDNLTAWSVHSSVFPLLADAPFSMTYKASVSVHDVLEHEETKVGFILTLNESTKLYIRASRLQKEAITKWLQKTTE